MTKEQGGKRPKLHVDLYTKDFVLMTVDHIVPKYVGKQLEWSNAQIEHLSNKQPMCEPCNANKGHKNIELEQIPTPPLRRGFGAIWQLVENSNIFNKEIRQNT